MFSACRLLMQFISGSNFFLYRFDHWFSFLNGFTLVISKAIYRALAVWCEPRLCVED